MGANEYCGLIYKIPLRCLKEFISTFSQLFLCASLFAQCPFPQILPVYFESFEEGLPQGWKAEQGSDGANWKLDQYGIGYYANPGEGNWLYVNDEEKNNVGNIYLTTSTYDLNGWEFPIVVEMDLNFQQFDEKGKLSVYQWNGDHWKRIWMLNSDFHGHVSFLLDTLSTSKLSLRFYYEDENVWNWGWGLDNFTIRPLNDWCGNGICDLWETPANCPGDCPSPTIPNPYWVDIGTDIRGESFPYRYFKGDTKCDDCSEEIALGFTYQLYNQSFSKVFLNSNGNITFRSSYSEYTPEAFCLRGPFMVAPFFSDVDIRHGGEVRYMIDPAGHYAIFTWSEVAYYGCKENCPLRNTFQCILTDGTVHNILGQPMNLMMNAAFIYKEMQWTTGSSSGGKKGFGGEAATVGINEGDGTHCMDYGRFGHFGYDYYGNSHEAQCPPNGVSHMDFKSLWLDGNRSQFVDLSELNNGVETDTPTITFFPEGSGSDSLASFYLEKIYPNPFQEVLQIEYYSPYTANVLYYLVDQSGRSVIQDSFLGEEGRQKQTINLPSLPSGTYFFYLNHPSGAGFEKLIRQ